MMSFFKFFLIKKKEVGETFLSNLSDKTKNIICGIGKSKILKNTIEIKKYPFEPSIVYVEKIIKASEINSICYDSFPPMIRINDEVIFITREYMNDLKEFTKVNNLKTFKETNNWNMLLEPYLDTEYTKECDIRMTKLLNENGITTKEINKIRNEVEKQMYKYNFDTMLWDWCNLGLNDVLCAMRVKYNKKNYQDFYKRAMEIELRQKLEFYSK